MKKVLFAIFIISLSNALLSQEKRKLITGKVLDSTGIIKNANIINFKTKQGTFSSEQGLFRIFVSKGDSLSVSSVQHTPKIIVITERILNQKKLTILLKSATYTLSEFELKRHNLMGRLDIDSKDVPRDVQDSLLRNIMDFSNVDFSQKDYKIDAIELARPPIVNTMSGAMGMSSGGASTGSTSKDSERLWALRKDLAQKKAFPYKILSELGEKFFFDELKIPLDRYFHFLEYCNSLNIETLHKEGKFLNVIKILRDESVPYLEIIKKE
ncbi:MULTISPECIES: hypothetical protein [unclassified Polaribacter]|uniref:hypothetical protein n=1 Tax=unclassified Polaribacter TaxID=196858 RepID=UPI0011BDF4A4|nr:MULTISPECIES: hypothetical protein [unclassified Polaribacter]TXD52922.1 hypothetical protein ES043_06860 [Polaribacter sp. IC063]TXD60868.1 hypothetical protein ES044_06825 [Polaribacter sp. IC066]